MRNGARAMAFSMDCVSMQQINKIKISGGFREQSTIFGQNNMNSKNAEESHYCNKDVSLHFRAQGSGFPLIKLIYTHFLLAAK